MQGLFLTTRHSPINMVTEMLLTFLLGSAVVWHSSSGHELLDMTHTYDNGSLFWPNGQASFQLTILSLGETGNGYWYVTVARLYSICQSFIDHSCHCTSRPRILCVLIKRSCATEFCRKTH